MGLVWGEDRVAALQLQRRLGFGGIAMDDGKPVQAPILGEQIDDAPVGKGGNDQVRDALQLGLVVERAGQDLARLGEESDVVLTADPVDEVLAGSHPPGRSRAPPVGASSP